ncbi:MAG: glutamate synthase subunit beta [Phycisphaerae bacterium]|jgi:NAD(P)H-dependent glutamate synthase small subunit
MGEIKGFLKYKRQEVGHRPVEKRIHDFSELDLPLTPEQIHQQTARCMDCGIPFCHGAGCPLKNNIPELNELVYKGKWQQACELLHSTNNFPEITGRVCPAPCETACTLSINDEPVLIRHIEFQLVERGFKEGWIKPLPAKQKTGKKIAVVGSGPAGLTVAQQLARTGHSVVVFEKDERIGGLLRYGIPDFKLAKGIIDRRLEQLIAEGVEFQTGVNVGEDISARYLKSRFDCICLTMGTGQPRDLNIPGRGYENILFALDYLKAQNQLCAGEPVDESSFVTVKNRVVVVIGGGDTGSDCVGTARRQGAKEIYQIEILPEPPETPPPDTPWPQWPRIMRTSSSHEEGCRRQWAVLTKKFSGVGTRVDQLDCCQVEWIRKNGSWKLKELAGTDFTVKADVVLLALGFLHVTHNELIKGLGLKLDDSGNVAADNYQTSEPRVFAAGDTVSGASLVVRAVNSGREAAVAIDSWLRKKS